MLGIAHPHNLAPTGRGDSVHLKERFAPGSRSTKWRPGQTPNARLAMSASSAWARRRSALRVSSLLEFRQLFSGLTFPQRPCDLNVLLECTEP